jgi:hypothetical protein
MGAPALRARPHSGGQRPLGAGRRSKRKFIMENGIVPTFYGGKPAPPTSAKPENLPKPSTKSIPIKLLAYNCSPSFNWRAFLSEAELLTF